jgi:hypothetical protein
MNSAETGLMILSTLMASTFLRAYSFDIITCFSLSKCAEKDIESERMNGARIRISENIILFISGVTPWSE